MFFIRKHIKAEKEEKEDLKEQKNASEKCVSLWCYGVIAVCEYTSIYVNLVVYHSLLRLRVHGLLYSVIVLYITIGIDSSLTLLQYVSRDPNIIRPKLFNYLMPSRSKNEVKSNITFTCM